LKRKSLELLRTYIDGYMAMQYELDDNYRGTFALNGFQEFIQKKYEKKYELRAFSHSWDRIIDFYSLSDEEAFDTFYKLLDEFLGERKDLYR
jgi:hypothetical protein